MEQDNEHIDDLLKKFEDRTLTADESRQLFALLEKDPSLIEARIADRALLHQAAAAVGRNINWEQILNTIVQVDRPSLKGMKSSKTWLKWAVAAAILIAGFAGFYHYRVTTTLQRNIFAADIAPGKNKAVLTLANGKTISLTDAANGDIAREAGISITKTADGQLSYVIAEAETPADPQLTEIKMNTISTPTGGQWQIRLPDGTQVWLNASSSLSYPLVFSGRKERRVELSGEAYFEVSKDAGHPFIVQTARQDIKVLGTHFNVSAYADDLLSETTLLEGSVQVNSFASTENVMLQPGEQASVSPKGIRVEKVDVEEAIAWKKGYFMFNNEKQESIMRKIARWYDVDVEYADPEARQITYYGTVSRFEKVSQVLRKFQQTGEVRFEIDGRKIIVYKNKTK